MKKRRTGKKTRRIRNIRLALTVLMALAIGAGLLGYQWFRANRIPGFTREAEVFVYPGETLPDIHDRILAAGPKSEKALDAVFEDKKVEKYLTPGHYTIKPSYSYVFVARMFNNGWQTPVRVSLNGALRLKKEIASCLASQLLVPQQELLDALEDKALLSKYGVTPETVSALFMPDTYEMWWTSGVQDILAHQKRIYDQFWTEERSAKAASQGLTRMQVSTLASIVNSESNYQPEFPLIAGVYLNRLRSGEKLQACPTVAFCYDFKLNRVLDRHLRIDSPYNTYRYPGLPPGPICCPTKEAMDAVLDADTSKGYKFFCASPEFNGTHRFAVTYRQHMANSREYSAELDRRHQEKLNGEHS